MKNDSKKKFSFKKFLKTFGKILLAFVCVIFLLCIIFHKILFGAADMLYKIASISEYSSLEYEEIHLTQEQMLKDYEYFYDHLYTDSLVKEQAEKYLKLDYDKLHDSYKERILNCQDEFEFFSLLMSFSAKLPGLHNYVQAPTDDLNDASSFPLYHEFGSDEVMKSNYILYKQFEDRMFEYNQKFIYFCYVNGDYVALYDGFDENELIEGIKNGRLLSLNGKKVEEVLPEIDTIQKFGYDSYNDKIYTSEIIFNDEIGEKYTAEIELPDGTVVTKDLYNSCDHVAATYYKNRIYPNHYDNNESAAETETAPKTEEADAAPAEIKRCYSIEKVPEKKLIVLTIKNCNSLDTEDAFKDITEALKEVDAENVIIDNRNNKGGTYTFITKGVCPALFNYDFEYKSYSRTPINDMTDKLYSNSFYKTFFETGLKKEEDCYSYYEDFSFKGKAEKSYNIYMINGLGTFSSGDIFAGLMKDQPNVTTIGLNTGGEGFTGHPLNYYLPESKIPFTMAFSVSVNHPEDNYLGTTPDIYIVNGWKEYLERSRLAEDPEYADIINSFEGRMLWDTTMIETVKMIN